MRPAVVRGEELVDQEAPRAVAAARERVEDEQLRGRIGTTCRPREPSTADVVDTAAPERECAGDRLQHRGFEEPLLVVGHLERRAANAARRRGCGAGQRTRLLREQDLVDDMDDAVRRLDVGRRHAGAAHGHLASVDPDRDGLAVEGLGERSVTTLAAGTLPLTTW